MYSELLFSEQALWIHNGVIQDLDLQRQESFDPVTSNKTSVNQWL
jgi:hypothetical protein